MYNTAYSTHGHWATAQEVLDIETERGNPIAEGLKQAAARNMLAMWVAAEAETAVRYNRPASNPPSEAMPITAEELAEIVTVDMYEAIIIDSDDEGGWLIVKDVICDIAESM